MTDFQTTLVIVFVTDETGWVKENIAYEVPVSPTGYMAYLASKGVVELFKQAGNATAYFNEPETNRISIFTKDADIEWVTAVSSDSVPELAAPEKDTATATKGNQMTENYRDVETVDEASDLDWEVKDAKWDVPVLDFNSTDAEISENDELKSEAIATCLKAFEKYNKVSLQGEALDYFRTSAEVYYSVF